MYINIRPCSITELDKLQAIGYETYDETFRTMNSQETIDSYLQEAFNKKKLLAELNNKNSLFYFLYAENELAGYLKINDAPAQSDINDTDSIEMERIYIKIYHMGIRSKVSKSTLADANEKRDWRIYRDFAKILIDEARRLYAGEDFGLQLQETIYALDATIIDLCLSVFPWAQFRKTKAAIKLHTLLDLRGNIPSMIAITDGKVHEVNILDRLEAEIGSIYIMDRGYLDFKRLYTLHQVPAFFIIRSKSNLAFRRIYSRPIDKSCGLLDLQRKRTR